MALDQEKLNKVLHQGVNDFGATFHAACVILGDKLGLYKGLAAGGPQTPAELAKRTGTTERYVREWLASQAAGGYITLEAATGRFSLSEEQAFTLADENSPAFLPGAFQVALAATKAVPRLVEAFRTGEGMGWHEHDHELFHGTERFFRPGYAAHLVTEWIPSLTGIEARLKAGARVADVGCGHGASTVLMAKAYPKSTFSGFDYHDGSIQTARARAREAGVADRVNFEVAHAKDFPGSGYDLVTFFDCLHDMGDPVGAGKHVKETLAEDGSWMIVEPFAHDHLKDNLNPVGRILYHASTFICTPASLSQEVALGLGAQAGERRLRQVATEAGFKRFSEGDRDAVQYNL